jgi:hypothetical protein
MMCQSQEIAARIYPEGFQLFRTEEKRELKNGGQGALRSDEFLTLCVSGWGGSIGCRALRPSDPSEHSCGGEVPPTTKS